MKVFMKAPALSALLVATFFVAKVIQLRFQLKKSLSEHRHSEWVTIDNIPRVFEMALEVEDPEYWRSNDSVNVLELTKGQNTLWHSFHSFLFGSLVMKLVEKNSLKESYVNLMYFGVCDAIPKYGLRPASLCYFEKDVGSLTLSESTTLVALAGSPTLLKADSVALKRKRDLLLNRMYATGKVSKADFENASKDQPRLKM